MFVLIDFWCNSFCGCRNFWIAKSSKMKSCHGTHQPNGNIILYYWIVFTHRISNLKMINVSFEYRWISHMLRIHWSVSVFSRIGSEKLTQLWYISNVTAVCEETYTQFRDGGMNTFLCRRIKIGEFNWMHFQHTFHIFNDSCALCV